MHDYFIHTTGYVSDRINSLFDLKQYEQLLYEHLEGIVRSTTMMMNDH